MRPGDIVRVYQKIKEKDKTRIQVFEGLVIARKHGAEPGATFTVRKISQGVGVERIYPLHSSNVEKIEIVKRSPKVRRAKLYYIREKAARESRKRLRHEYLASKITVGSIEEESSGKQSSQETDENRKESPLTQQNNEPKSEKRELKEERETK